MASRFLLIASVMVLSLFLPWQQQRAMAQVSPEVQALVEQATRDARNRRYEQAVEGFKRAYELSKEPAYLYNVAALLLFRLKDAAGAWDYAMRYRSEARTPEETREAEELIAQAEAELQKTHGKLAISVLPTTADVYLDDVSPAKRLPRMTVWLLPGSYTVIARAPGYSEARTPVIVRLGVLNEVSIRMIAEKATLEVLSKTPKCAVRVDDRDLGLAPVRIDLEPGQHTVRAEAQGFVPFEQRVMLGPGESVVVHADLEPVAKAVVPQEKPIVAKEPEVSAPGSVQRTWAWVAIGSGAALGIVGSALYGVAYKELEDASGITDQAAYDSKVNSARKKGYAGYALWGVGAAAIATGLVLYFTAPDGGGTAVSVAPGGLALSFSW